MIRKCVDQVVPVSPISWRRNISLVREDSVAAAREGFGHEAKLHERAHTVFKHEIVNLIDVEEIQISTTPRSNTHFVIEQAMAAYRLEACGSLHAYQVLSPLIPETDYDSVGACGFLPEVSE